jgi:hypothetical protein
MAEAHSTSGPRCTWCDIEVALGDGYRAAQRPGAGHAVFCRLEHIVPWGIKGARWEAVEPDEWPGAVPDGAHCACCDKPIVDVHVVLVRHRGEHRIPDAFCSADHMQEWAKAGGRWR